ncbi:phage scaffolding protein [Lacticaseibacillus paracasei]|uniref:phage scaffolding protein n=1 Tax=Lacticaseibacillus paracasei TaxID=1597 RepID=UPI001AD7DC7C|nr:phage scaffolding protein [Lacticaseibacillus paracasei]QTH68358.1 phage scaffolding protein [Lacticaseibacillus paracasei]UWY25670.1 phage scaffolding protein [Lacticaseibacillus paracasei]
MKREELKGLGLSDEQVDKVMGIHGTDVNDLKGQVSQLTTERDALKQRATDSDKQLNELKAAHKDDKDFQAEIDKLKADNKAKDDAASKQLKETQLNYQTELALVKAGALNTKAASALIDKDKLSLDEKGNVTGLDEQLKALKSDDSSKFLFKAEEAPKPQNTPPITVPGNPNPNANGTLNPATATYEELAASMAHEE